MNDRWTDRLSEYIDGELDAEQTRALEEHLESCGSCRGILHELRQVVQRAHAVEDFEPDEELWEAIAARIEERTIEVPEPRRAPRGPRSTRSARTVRLEVPQLVAAGLALMILSGALGWFARPRDESGALGPGADSPARVAEHNGSAVEFEPVDDGLWRESGTELAAVRWEEAVESQEAVYRQMRSQIDTTTVRVLEKNLGLLDRSIEEIKEARQEDPGNPLWNNRLADSLKRKLRLLRWASSISTRET